MCYSSLNEFVQLLSRRLQPEKVKQVIWKYQGSDIFKPVYLFFDPSERVNEAERFERRINRELHIQGVIRRYERDPQYVKVCELGEVSRAIKAAAARRNAQPTSTPRPVKYLHARVADSDATLIPSMLGAERAAPSIQAQRQFEYSDALPSNGLDSELSPRAHREQIQEPAHAGG